MPLPPILPPGSIVEPQNVCCWYGMHWALCNGAVCMLCCMCLGLVSLMPRPHTQQTGDSSIS